MTFSLLRENDVELPSYQEKLLINKKDLEVILPHRGNALVLDGILEFNKKKKMLVAIKYMDDCGKYIEGHFPHYPIYPGHWQLEIAALAAVVLGVLLFKKSNKNSSEPILRGFGDTKFPKMISFDDSHSPLVIRVKFVEKKFRLAVFNCIIMQNGEVKAEIKRIRGIF